MILDPTLIKAGFLVPQVPKTKRVVLCTRALDKMGKTHFAVDGAPPPVAIVALDTGTKEVASKFIGRKELICSYHRVTGRMASIGETQEVAAKEWDQVKQSIIAATEHPKVRSLVVDTGTEVHELVRLAHFGKLEQVLPHHYGPVNKELRNLVKMAYDREDLNVFWIHKMKKQYGQNKKGEDSWTGKYEMAGFSDMPYLCDLTLEHYWSPATPERSGRFGVRVSGVSRQTPDVCGLELEGDDCNFPTLAMMLYPEVDPSWWS